jgi:beta-lactamase regulating signal transducer with metallopeptidase domain/protocatechuate 3,4-dioxygenase beta subunit
MRWEFFGHLVGRDQKWELMLDPAICSQLCLTLLHSMWLVTLLAAFAWIADRLVGRRAVERSYAIHVAALLVSVVALPATYWIVAALGVAPQPELAMTADGMPVAETVFAATSPAPVPSDASPVGEAATEMFVPIEAQDTGVAAAPLPVNVERAEIWTTIAPWFAGLYLAGVAIMLARVALGIWRAQRLGAGADLLREGPLVDLLRSLTEQWSMRVVPVLARADQIVTPKVIGLVRPTILLPASAVSGLSTDELELILAHELAHVRRYDMWVNLLQRLAEAVLFFNPALWYLSRRVSLLREYCCDEVVCGSNVDSGEPHLRYAQALLRAVEVAGGARDKTELASLAATGRSPSELRRRVARLFGEPMAESVRLSRTGAIAIGLLAVLLLAAPLVWQTADASRQEEPAAEEPVTYQPGTVTISGRIVLEDGSSATQQGWLYSDSTIAPSEGVSKTEGQFTDSFSIEVPAGRTLLTYFPDGFAPAWYGPVVAGPGETLDDVTFVLKPGYSAPLHVVNEQNEPIPGATFYSYPRIEAGSGGPVIRKTTDAQGKYLLQHLAETPYRFEVTAAGYEKRTIESLSLQKDVPLVLQMRRCKPTTGIVLNADGTPAVGAAFHQHYEATDGLGGSRGLGEVAATTDTDGRFELDQVARGSWYAFVVKTAEHARVVVPLLRAGEQDVRVTVPPRRDLHVRIIGDLDKLRKTQEKPSSVAVQQRVRYGAREVNRTVGDLLRGDVFVTPNDEGGIAVYQGLVADNVTVTAGDQEKTVPVVDVGVTEVVFRFGGAEGETAKKEATGNGEAETPERTTAPITVFGRALDLEGKPIKDADIYLASRRVDYKRLATTTTDAEGRYRFKEVPLPIGPPDTASHWDRGIFEVFGIAEGFGLSWLERQSFYPDRTQVLDTTFRPQGEVRTGFGTEDPIELDLTFGPASTLHGRVVDDRGQPIADAELAIRRCERISIEDPLQPGLESLNDRNIVPERIKRRITDKEGRFEFTGLPANRLFSIDVRPPGFTRRRVNAATQEGVDKDSQGNRVYSGDMEIVFARPRKVKFRVVYGDSGELAEKVGISGTVSVAGFLETTDADGSAETLLPDGQYTIGLLPRYQTHYLRTKTEITVSEETAKEPFTLELDPAAIVDITVLDADSGEPLEGADVWLEMKPSESMAPFRRAHGYRSWEVETSLSRYVAPRSDANGRMRVLFEPGKHRIGVGKEAYPEGYEPVEAEGKVIDCQLGKPTAVEFQMRKRVASGSEPSASSEPPAPAKQFSLHIVDPDNKPIPGALVEIRTSPIPEASQILRGEFVSKSTYGPFAKADDDGRLVVALPKNPDRLNFSITTPGYGPYWANCHADYCSKTVPNEFTAQLEHAWSIGGIVVDDEGNPIEGVEIWLNIDYKKRPGDNRQLGMGDRFKTDAQGNWNFDSVPVSMNEVWCEMTHPDFMPNRQSLTRAEFEIEQGEEPKGKVVLTRGLSVSGTVTDDSGKPVEGALVRTQFFNDIRKAETNEDGVYQLVGCEPRMTRIVVTAKGRAVDMEDVRIEPGMAPVDFQMKPGETVRIRVLDENDAPIPKARIFFQWWRGGQAYFDFNHVNQYADENGVWEWNEAPHDEFQADICRPGGMQITRQKLIARDEEYVLYPPPALVITGTVVDAETKQPIRNFHAVPGRQDANERIIWDRDEGDQSTDGEYRLVRTYGCHAHLVQIEASGYLSTLSRQIKNDEGTLTLNFELSRGKDVAATVLTPDGKPAAKAEAALGIAGSQIRVENGNFTRSTYAARQTADESGRFQFPAQGANFQVVVIHPTGYAYIKDTSDAFPETINLTAWARVEGIFRIGKQTAGNVPLRIIASDLFSFGDDAPSVDFSHEVTTMPDGSFAFERVVPGRGRIGRNLVLMVSDGALEKKTSCMVRAYFPAGETTRLDLGGTGRTVIGKLQPPAGFKQKVFWNFALVTLRSDLTRPETPQSLEEGPSDPEARRKRWAEWRDTDEGKAWAIAYEQYEKLRDTKPYITATVGSDGTFRLDDLPADEYTLRVRFSRESPGHLRDYRFEVPPAADSSPTDPIDLGILKLNPSR